MQITVKAVKVLKTGTKGDMDWKLVGVTSEDGTNYATFHKSAENLTPGTVIDIGDPIIKENKLSFKEYKVISAAPAPANGQAMNPELWAEKDKLDRQSREAIACFQGVVDLVIARTILVEGELSIAALDWAMAHFQPVKVEKPTYESGAQPVYDTGDFKNLGEFLTRVTKELNIKRDEIAEKLSINDVKEITDYAKAWATLTGKEPEKEEGGEVAPEDLPFS